MTDLEYIEKIGSGSQGSVWKGKDKTGRVVAIKITRLTRWHGLDKLEKEVNALKKISLSPNCNPYIVCYYDSYHDVESNKFILVMEFIDGENLTKYSNRLRKANSKYLTKDIYLITKDIATGIQILHDNDIIHRDIKPDNIVIDKNKTPKLVDFGLVCETIKCDYREEKIDCCKGNAGTPNYMAPEVLNLSVAYFASDIWSFGATIYYSITGKTLYPKVKTISQLKSALFREPVPILSSGNKYLDEIVNKSLMKHSFKRITVDDINNIYKEADKNLKDKNKRILASYLADGIDISLFQ